MTRSFAHRLVFATASLCLIPAADAVELPFSQTTIDGNEDGLNGLIHADIDADGDLDLVAAVTTEDEVVVWRNDAGAWTRVVVDASLDAAIGLHTGDIDGDGDLDIASAGYNADDIRWYANDGTGAVWTQTIVASSFDEAWDVRIADLDGDGDADLVGAADAANSVLWWENTAGDGSSWTEHTIDAGLAGATWVEVGDIDRDGRLDVVASGYDDDDIALYLNQGGASSWVSVSITGSFDGAWPLDLADMDRDGDLDVLGSASVGDDVAWFENTLGDGSSWTQHDIDLNYDFAREAVAIDLDLDGDLDVVATAGSADDVTFFENTDGVGTSWTEHTLAGNFNGAVCVTVGDFDADGDLDVAAGANLADDLALWTNDAVHTSSDTDSGATVATGAGLPRAPTTADVDGDGDLDVLVARHSGDEFTWYLNDGTGTSWTQETVGTMDGAYWGRAADIDGDGDLDVAGNSGGEASFSWWENTGAAWTEHVVEAGSTNHSMWGIRAADLDRDGSMDLVVTNFAEGPSWYANTAGDGSAWTETVIESGVVGGAGIALGDLDSDGDLDLVMADNVGDQLFWYENTAGDGSAWTRATVDTGLDNPRDPELADVDLDGDLDIVVTTRSGDEVLWYANSGDGSTWTQALIGTSTNPCHGLPVDFDQDGDIDVLVSDGSSGDVDWWENQDGVGSAWTAHTIDSSLGTNFGVAAGDLDGDGDLEVVAAAYSGGAVVTYDHTRAHADVDHGDVAAGTYTSGTSVALFEIDGEHLGRSGDSDIELDTLFFLLDDASGAALTGADMASLFTSIEVVLDDGDGSWSAATDTDSAGIATTFSVSAGEWIMTLTDGDPDAAVSHGTDVTWWVVGHLAATATTSTLSGGVTIELDGPGSTIEDASADLALDAENPDLATVGITVDMIPVADVGGGYTADEGDTVTVDGSNSYDDGAVVSWDWDCDGDGVYEVSGTNPTVGCTMVDDGTTTVGLEVTDDTGNTSSTSTPVAVANVAPTITTVDTAVHAVEGTAFTFTPTATDPGTADVLTWSAVGMPSGMTLDTDTGEIAWTPALDDVGGTAIAWTVDDGDGGTDDHTVTVNVTFVDDDADGLPDTWETANGLDPTVDDAALDNDGDGLDNATEYAGGTSPTTFDGPTAPTATAPLNGDEVETLRPELAWDAATDPQSDDLTYEVEIHGDVDLTNLLDATSGRLVLSWTPDVALPENTDVFWRVRAADPYTPGPWSQVQRVFVNHRNDPPEVPTASAPLDGDRVDVLRPRLSWTTDGDVDRDEVRFDVRVHDEAGDLVAEVAALVGTDRDGEWEVDVPLLEDGLYTWDVRAGDEHSLFSGWSVAQGFLVSTTNAVPTTPVWLAPEDGEELTDPSPTLRVAASEDAEGDALVYEIEVDEWAATVEADGGVVVWELAAEDIQLPVNVDLTARVRAVDATGGASEWAAITFLVFQEVEDDDVVTGGCESCESSVAARRSGSWWMLVVIAIVGLRRRP